MDQAIILSKTDIIFRRILAGRHNQGLFLIDMPDAKKALDNIESQARDLGCTACRIEPSEKTRFPDDLFSAIQTIISDFGDCTKIAHTGNADYDFSEWLTYVGDLAKKRGSGVAILIDESHRLPIADLGNFLQAIHLMNQRALPVVALGTGEAVLRRMMGDARPYGERLFSFISPPLAKLDLPSPSTRVKDLSIE